MKLWNASQCGILHAKLFAFIDLHTHVHNIYTYTQYSSLISLYMHVNCISKEKKTQSQIAQLKDVDLIVIPATFKAWLLTVFENCSLKNTFRNKLSAVKWWKSRFWQQILLSLQQSVEKFTNMKFILSKHFLGKLYKCSEFSLPSSLISEEYVCKIKQICFFSCFSYFLVLHWLCFMMSCWYCKTWIVVCKIIQLKKLNDSNIPILSKVEETKRPV